jgi:peptidoglycan/LPS O-acetylase OafA/YrhL
VIEPGRPSPGETDARRRRDALGVAKLALGATMLRLLGMLFSVGASEEEIVWMLVGRWAAFALDVLVLVSLAAANALNLSRPSRTGLAVTSLANATVAAMGLTTLAGVFASSWFRLAGIAALPLLLWTGAAWLRLRRAAALPPSSP